MLREIRELRRMGDFRGTVTDLGGPTANMYRMKCRSEAIESRCRKLSCVHSGVCENLVTDHSELIEALQSRCKIILVDFHAETTAEKMAMGWHLDGRATLVVGTHTHVQSADERVLPNGTAYMTDAGMTGPHDGIIGMEREPSMSRFLTGLSSKLEPASANPRLNGVLVSTDDKTGRATSITRLSYSEQDLAALASSAKTESRIPNPESRLASPTK